MAPGENEFDTPGLKGDSRSPGEGSGKVRKEGKDFNKGDVIDLTDYHTGAWGSVPWDFQWRGGSGLLIH